MPSTFFLPPLPPPFSANPFSSFLCRLIDHFSFLLVLLPSLLSFLSLLLASCFFLLLRLCGSSYPHSAAPVKPPPRQPALFARVYITRTVDSPYITFSISLVRSLLDFCSSCSFFLFFSFSLYSRSTLSRFARTTVAPDFLPQKFISGHKRATCEANKRYRVFKRVSEVSGRHRGIGWRCFCDVTIFLRCCYYSC